MCLNGKSDDKINKFYEYKNDQFMLSLVQNQHKIFEKVGCFFFVSEVSHLMQK